MRRVTGARATVLAGSALAHAVVLAALGASRGVAINALTQSPTLQVQLVPDAILPASSRSPPKLAAHEEPAARAVRPRLARLPSENAPISPLHLPPGTSPTTNSAASIDGVRAALRSGGLGCANANALGLGKRARARCLERLGAGAHDAPFIPTPLAHEKQSAFDGTAARKAADREYREAQIPPGLSKSDAAGGITGLGQTGHGSVPFP